MEIQAVLDEETFNGLDESVQSLYRHSEQEGLYKLNIRSDEAAKLAPDLTSEVERLRSHANKVLSEKKAEAEARRELEQRLQDLENQPPKKKQEADPALAAQLESFKLAKEEAEGKLKQYQQQVAQSMKRAEIARLRAEHNLNETAEFVLDKFLEVASVDGSDELSLRVVENGKPAFIGGDAVTPDGLIDSFLRNGIHKGIFNAPQGGGTGGRNDFGSGKAGQKTMKRAAFDQLNAQEKVTFMREGGTLVD